jgi:RNA polymerase sigma factor (sigma-70 family)
MPPWSATLASRRRDDAALTSRTARADAAAFADVYERHHQALYRYCRSILRHDEDARDALQNTMLRGFAALQSEERDFELKPWLFRIAHNEAVTILRQRRPARALDAIVDLGDDTLDRTLEDRSRLTQLRADLADLPEKQRAALVLRELSGLSHDEIARAIESTPRNVKQTIFEARTALHEFHEGRDMSCDPVRRAISDGDGRVLRGRRIRAHLRSCDGCRSFHAELVRRPAELAVLAPPLPVAAGTALLAHLLPSGATAATTACAASSAATTAGVASSASTGLFAGAATKAAVFVAVAATAAGGAVGVPRASRVLGLERASGLPTQAAAHADPVAGRSIAAAAHKPGVISPTPPGAASAGAAATTSLPPTARPGTEQAPAPPAATVSDDSPHPPLAESAPGATGPSAPAAARPSVPGRTKTSGRKTPPAKAAAPAKADHPSAAGKPPGTPAHGAPAKADKPDHAADPGKGKNEDKASKPVKPRPSAAQGGSAANPAAASAPHTAVPSPAAPASPPAGHPAPPAATPSAGSHAHGPPSDVPADPGAAPVAATPAADPSAESPGNPHRP